MSKNLLSEQFDKNQKNKEKPKDVFSRAELDEIKTKKASPAAKTSSIRISIKNINRIKAMSDILQLGSLDEAINSLLEAREIELKDSQKMEYKTLVKILNKKRNV